MYEHCLTRGALLAPDEPRLRLFWDLTPTHPHDLPAMNVVHERCVERALIHLLRRNGEQVVQVVA